MTFLPVLKDDDLNERGHPFIRHGFFTRQGGVSEGKYHSLNIGLGSDDNPHHVAQNRQRIAAYFGVESERMLTVHQCHSTDVFVASQPLTGARPKADALVSNVSGLVLAVATADCAPILLLDAKNKVIGAAHAGWRGAYGGILENTVTAMETLGAKRQNIIAVVGPCIGRKNYQVGEEFFARFIEQSSDNERYFTIYGQKKHYFFDLASYNVDRLKHAGVACRALNLCTYENEAQFYSYRRMTHKQEADYGRQLSAIIMEKSS